MLGQHSINQLSETKVKSKYILIASVDSSDLCFLYANLKNNSSFDSFLNIIELKYLNGLYDYIKLIGYLIDVL